MRIAVLCWLGGVQMVLPCPAEAIPVFESMLKDEPELVSVLYLLQA